LIRGVLLDLSGVLYVGRQALPGALDAVARLGQSGIPIRYITNTTRSPRRMIMEQLRAMGFSFPEGDVYTAPLAALDYLQARGLTPYLVVHSNLIEELAGVSSPAPDAVLIGDAGEGFTYQHMNSAFRLLLEGAPLLAMGSNRYFKEADGLSLDAGPFVAALEYAAGVRATIIGKPAAAFFHAAVASLGCAPGATVMVGDDVDADVIGALDAGLPAILVRTGKFRPGDEQKVEGRAPVLEDISAAVDWILQRL